MTNKSIKPFKAKEKSIMKIIAKIPDKKKKQKIWDTFLENIANTI